MQGSNVIAGRPAALVATCEVLAVADASVSCCWIPVCVQDVISAMDAIHTLPLRMTVARELVGIVFFGVAVCVADRHKKGFQFFHSVDM